MKKEGKKGPRVSFCDQSNGGPIVGRETVRLGCQREGEKKRKGGPTVVISPFEKVKKPTGLWGTKGRRQGKKTRKKKTGEQGGSRERR